MSGEVQKQQLGETKHPEVRWLWRRFLALDPNDPSTEELDSIETGLSERKWVGFGAPPEQFVRDKADLKNAITTLKKKIEDDKLKLGVALSAKLEAGGESIPQPIKDAVLQLQAAVIHVESEIDDRDKKSYFPNAVSLSEQLRAAAEAWNASRDVQILALERAFQQDLPEKALWWEREIAKVRTWFDSIYELKRLNEDLGELDSVWRESLQFQPSVAELRQCSNIGDITAASALDTTARLVSLEAAVQKVREDAALKSPPLTEPYASVINEESVNYADARKALLQSWENFIDKRKFVSAKGIPPIPDGSYSLAEAVSLLDSIFQKGDYSKSTPNHLRFVEFLRKKLSDYKDGASKSWSRVQGDSWESLKSIQRIEQIYGELKSEETLRNGLSMEKTERAKSFDALVAQTQTDIQNILLFKLKDPALGGKISELKTTRLAKLEELAQKLNGERDGALEKIKKDITAFMHLFTTVVLLMRSIGATKDAVQVSALPSAQEIDLTMVDLGHIIVESGLVNKERPPAQVMALNEFGEYVPETVRRTDIGEALRCLERTLSLRQEKFITTVGAEPVRIDVRNFPRIAQDLPQFLVDELQIDFFSAYIAVFIAEFILIMQSYVSQDPNIFYGVSDGIGKIIRMIDDVQYRLEKGRFTGAVDFVTLLARPAIEGPSGIKYIDHPAYEEYIHELEAKVPNRLKNHVRLLFEPVSPMVPDRSGAGKVGWMSITSFTTLLHSMDLGWFIDNSIPADPVNDPDDKQRRTKKRTAYHRVEQTSFGEQILYEELPFGNLPSVLLGNFLNLDMNNSIYPFQQIVYGDPSEILKKMQSDTAYATWNTIFQYALPYFGYLRNIEGDIINAKILPVVRAKFMLGFLLWGTRSEAIKPEEARKILRNAREQVVETELSDGKSEKGTFLTEEYMEAIMAIIDEPGRELANQIIDKLQQGLTYGAKH